MQFHRILNHGTRKICTSRPFHSRRDVGPSVGLEAVTNREFQALGSLCHNSILIKIQLDAAVGSLIYSTAKSLYMFRLPTAPIIRSTKNCIRSLRYRS